MILNKFLTLIDAKSECSTKSVFGNTGVFYRGAMFAQVNKQQLLLRGGNHLTPLLKQIGCKPYVHQKKNSAPTMDYYDVSELFHEEDNRIREFAVSSYQAALQDRHFNQVNVMSKLRDLPNMSHRLERMLSRCEITTIEQFRSKGAVASFIELRNFHGVKTIPEDVLYKFYGAIHHIHWQVVSEEDKQHLQEECRRLEWEMGLRRFDH